MKSDTSLTDKDGVLTGRGFIPCPECWSAGVQWWRFKFDEPCEMCLGKKEIPTTPTKEELE